MNDLFKAAILEKRPKAYSNIIAYYYDKINFLQPKLFIAWLTTELGLPVGAISYTSFNTALYRHNKRMKKIESAKKAESSTVLKTEKLNKVSDFKFPDPNTSEFSAQTKPKEDNSFKSL